ncbi:MAG: hypothetical protein COV67_03125 [Nitrospinae bacterium CG11_big_fil_rev_8_21_14_0_20_56_8]|nr:MAG: hypothetical protein COV67_03125 [Nitrospinae bacterium CG11_big_fil_rev_8_21_14_0_20_56_8]
MKYILHRQNPSAILIKTGPNRSREIFQSIEKLIVDRRTFFKQLGGVPPGSIVAQRDLTFTVTGRMIRSFAFATEAIGIDAPIQDAISMARNSL